MSTQDLIANLESLFRIGQIEVAAQCPAAPALLKELAAFERSACAGGRRETFAGKVGVHDDLVMAVAMAAWRAVDQDSRGIFSFRSWAVLMTMPKTTVDEDRPTFGLVGKIR